MNFSETHKVAVVENTGQLVKLRKSLKKSGYWVLAFIVIGVSAWMLYTDREKSEQKQTGGQQKQSVPQRAVQADVPLTNGPLSIPAGGRSGLILPIAGQHPEVTGFGKFRLHVVRADGTECIAGEADCGSGPLLKEYYLTNDDVKEITITVVFKPG